MYLVASIHLPDGPFVCISVCMRPSARRRDGPNVCLFACDLLAEPFDLLTLIFGVGVGLDLA